MNIMSLKTSIHNNLIRSGLEEVDRVLVSCLVYKEVRSKITIDTDIQSNVNEEINSCKSYYINTLSYYKNTYISYNKAKNYIEGLQNKNIIMLSESAIMEVCRIYFERVKSIPFSTTSFSCKMYNIPNLDKNLDDYLRHVHFDIIAPIAIYYNSKFGVPLTQVHINSADGVKKYPGKIVDFYITGIQSIRVISDIRTGNVGVNQNYIHSIILSDGRIQITTK